MENVYEKCGIIIPVYNERDNLEELLPRLYLYNMPIVVIDDGSKDRTIDLLKKQTYPHLHYLTHPTNTGMGMSLQTGLIQAKKYLKNIKYVIFIDGDLEHDPAEITLLLSQIDENTDLIVGNRDLSNRSLIYKIGNAGIQIIFKILTGKHFDSESGFRIWKLDSVWEIFKELEVPYHARGFEISFLSLFVAENKKMNIKSVNITQAKSRKKELNRIATGFEVIIRMLYYKIKNIR